MPNESVPPATAKRPRPDLAAMLEPIRHELFEAEADVLSSHGLSMWGYIVLLTLADEPIRTQAALADAIKADRTRIITVLDDLQDRGLIDRRPDPNDRRARLLALTAAGKQLRNTAQAAIQLREERMLSVLSPRARTEFLKTLQVLASERARALLHDDDAG
jgi:DNA-binding MarR family transcriptional regulator